MFFMRVSPRLLPWPFLPQHLPLAVLTQEKKPELAAPMNDKNWSRRPGYETKGIISIVSNSIAQVCSGHAGQYKAYPREMHFISVCGSRCCCHAGPYMISTASCSAMNLQIRRPYHLGSACARGDIIH